MGLTRRGFVGALAAAPVAANAFAEQAVDAVPPLSRKYAGTTLRVVFGTGSSWDAINPVSQEIAAAAGIRLELTLANYNDRYSKMILDASSGANAFDCYALAYQWKYEAAQFLADLGDADKIEGAAPLDLADYPPNLLDAYGKVDNRLIALPLIGDVTFFVRNMEAFKGAKLPLDPPPKTWKEVFTNAQKLKSNRWIGYSMPAGKSIQTAVIWMLLLHENGGKYFDAKNMPQFNSRESLDAIHFMTNELESVSVPDNLTWDYPQVVTAFTSGQAAQSMIWASSFGTVVDPTRSEVSDKVVWSASPGGSLLGGWGVAVNRRSRNLDAAKFWASWLTSTPMTRRLVPLGGTPCRRSAYKYPAFVARYPQYPAMLAALEGDLLTYPPVPQAEQLHIVIFDELNAAIARTKSPEQAAEDMQHKAMDFMTKRGLIRQ